MIEHEEERGFAEREPLVIAKRARTLPLLGLSISALAHAGALATLIEFHPPQAAGGEREIAVEVIAAASDSETSVAPPEAAPPIATPETSPSVSEVAPQRESAPSEGAPPIAAQPLEVKTSAEPASPQSSSILPDVQPRDQTAASFSTQSEPLPAWPPEISTAPPTQRAQAEPQRSAAHRQDIAEQRRREELQRRRRVKTAAERTREEARFNKEAKRKSDEARARKAEAKRKAETKRQQAALESRAAAPTSSPNPLSSLGLDTANYRSAVVGYLARFKRYPDSARARGAQGQSVVAFTLDGGGRVLSARIVRSSGDSDLDAETLAMVRRANPFPAPPQGALRSFSAAIQFHLQ